MLLIVAQKFPNDTWASMKQGKDLPSAEILATPSTGTKVQFCLLFHGYRFYICFLTSYSCSSELIFL